MREMVSTYNDIYISVLSFQIDITCAENINI